MNMNLRILELIEKRLTKGKKRYGKENISSDGRNFLQESLEEALDCAVYLAGYIIEFQDWQNKNKEWDKILPDYQRTGDETI